MANSTLRTYQASQSDLVLKQRSIIRNTENDRHHNIVRHIAGVGSGVFGVSVYISNCEIVASELETSFLGLSVGQGSLPFLQLLLLNPEMMYFLK